MAQIEFPVWTVSRAALAMPFRYPLALLKFGFLPLLIATICLPPAVNVGHTTSVTINGTPLDPTGDVFSTTDNELGVRDFIGFVLMLPFLACFVAAWSRLMATGDESSMGRPPIALDTRVLSVTWAFVRLIGVALGLFLGLFVVSLLLFGRYHDGQLSFSYNISVNGIGEVLAAGIGVLAVISAFAWFILRFALVIPAAAMGVPLKLQQSWKLSAPVQLRLLASAAMLTVVFVVLNLAIAVAMIALLDIADTKVTFYAAVVVSFLLMAYGHAIWAGLLGATYGLLKESQPIPNLAEVFD